MPQVMRADGFAFRMYYKDHPPPHVHVWKAGCRCRIALGEPGSAPYLLELGDMGRTDAGRALWMVNGCQEILLVHWRRIRERNSDRG